MKHFTSVQDISDWSVLWEKVKQIKQAPQGRKTLGQGKAMCLIFLNSSLRTRLSTQRAAMNIGLDTVVFDINQGGWQLEMADGVVMSGSKAEHVKEAAAVIGSYYDVIGIRAFAQLQDRAEDYQETIIQQFKKYAGVPIISLESSVRHPLQSLTDLITIEEYKKTERPKVVLSWAPHPRALPQAVANSFLEWMKTTDYEVVLTHPEGYDLAEEFTQGITSTNNQSEALQNADFVYVKNWSSYQDYGKIVRADDEWMITDEKMKLTNDAHFMHCLPVRRNVVVADGVIDSPNSLVIPQAAHRVTAAQTVLELMLDHA
ncbi:N-acetylornithine carbamoyltransferase [Tunicatimonas pelagia]|uniref:N-acetylornithine carbamoyltransferase n=1 Tax=Tunicatimonas pelagia TaxID=931531 RepID=UPI002665E86F|nr:N-acetylornithine carbamoyltransferase [Tunicatimonas pelagia]WKN42799.1 N-acetylornithine carbamoyltransferase [Tunicatimonas pelagia]